jgi:hypothetical protein
MSPRKQRHKILERLPIRANCLRNLLEVLVLYTPGVVAPSQTESSIQLSTTFFDLEDSEGLRMTPSPKTEAHFICI